MCRVSGSFVKGFEGGGGQIAQACVPPAGVVPTFDPLKDRCGQLLGTGPAPGVEQLSLHHGPERLDHRAGQQAAGDAANRAEQPRRAKPVAEGPGGVDTRSL